ncbi:MAG TPA: serine hydrolase [Baekduia sp.]|nr:serine hydrolase [Baekduia sp.]
MANAAQSVAGIGDVERPTLANWMEPPGNRWAFRHVREILPSERVAAAAASRALPTTLSDDLLDLAYSSRDGSESTVRGMLERTYGDAFLVLHDGRVVAEWHAPGVAVDDRHILFSVTKSITGLLAGVLADEGALDPTGPVAELVPEVHGSAFGDASVRDLLDMSVAMKFVEDYSPGPDVLRYRRSSGWYPDAEEGLYEYLASIPPDGDHGVQFRYLSPSTDMLGWVCERAAGTTYAQALSRRLWAPMGAEADGEMTVDRYGAPRAAGGLSATLRDTARLGQLLIEGEGVLPEPLVEDVLRGGDPALWATNDWAYYFPGGAYRSSWYQHREAGDGVVIAGGIHGQMIYVDAPRRVVVVKQSSWPTAEDEQADFTTYAAAGAIARELAPGKS